MSQASWFHQAKSAMAYVCDEGSLHLRFKAEKNTLTSVALLGGDPFWYDKNAEGKYVWHASYNEIPLTLEHQTALHDVFHIFVKPPFKRFKYAFVIDGHYLFGSHDIIDITEHPNLKTNLFNYFNFPYLLEIDRFKAPDWAENQRWYSIFPARYARDPQAIKQAGERAWDDITGLSNMDRYGGHLKGITSKLDYLKDMGFNGIYFTPLFDAFSQHKYDTNDYYSVDSQFGTNEDLKTLIQEAHQRGIKVMLDAVFNHCAVFHPFFLDVVEKGSDSPYYDGFYIKDHTKPVLDVAIEDLKDRDKLKGLNLFKAGSLNYETFAFTPYMPKINLEHPLMHDYFLKVAQHYVEEYDIDGWRLDVSNEIPHRFWRNFRDTVKRVKPDLYILGENWDESMPWLQGDQFDAVMNYGLLYPLWQTYGSLPHLPKYRKHDLIYALGKHLTTYPLPVLKAQYNLLDSHDTTRFLTLCDGDIRRFKQGYTCLYLMPGSPSVYYGDEIGMEGEHDPDNRRPMQWHQINEHIQAFFKRLNILRASDLRLNDTVVNFPDYPDDRVLIIQKGTLYAVFNLSDETLILDAQHLPKLTRNVYHDSELNTYLLSPFDVQLWD